MLKQLGNKRIALGILIVCMLFYPFSVGYSSYFLTLFVITCIYVITSLSLNLLVGYGGQISVGQAGFLSVGSYSVAILSTKLGLPFLVVLPLAGIITALIGLLIGLPAVRLKGHFLAVATLGFGLSVPQIALKWDKLTGGFSGLSVTPSSLFASETQLFYFFVFLTVLIIWLINNIVKSSIGRAFIAIRDSEVAAQAIGINLSFYKTTMFVISSFFTGIAGGIYGYWVGFVSPNDFVITNSFLILAMIVVGGLASIPGSIIGALLFSIIPHFTDSYVGITNIVIGVAVVLIILFKPKGMVSMFNFKRNKSEKTKKNELLLKEEGNRGVNI
ncbi:branched-chain amino acid ABC transporter permease [Paenibacillus sp. BSR1-1]|uniref:branched-chain amino acid ABC transporter permease n=1 Tax=Paenibacillus sp. BSR1-1 TaxID=3020845 RepID=UPI0025B21D19|nr:branched-chain amino acid ABC transporter permease [Paenibacillus sp. BSR1-1]MDN3016181.1 branched-chain amino acid ABC transporter permease [Paenibacillus sp. BSR1-1]